jgi:Flp pilus assembly protein TadD
VSDEYKWTQSWGPQTLPELLLIAKTNGTSAALRRYTEVKASSGKGAGIDESTLNMLGYTLLEDGQTQEAITVFQRNVQEYPQSSNVYDSLGEACLKAGQKDMAITNYKKSLQLDPKNQNAVEVLRKLKAEN